MYQLGFTSVITAAVIGPRDPSNFLYLQSVTEAAGAVVGNEQGHGLICGRLCHRR